MYFSCFLHYVVIPYKELFDNVQYYILLCHVNHKKKDFWLFHPFWYILDVPTFFVNGGVVYKSILTA